MPASVASGSVFKCAVVVAAVAAFDLPGCAGVIGEIRGAVPLPSLRPSQGCCSIREPLFQEYHTRRQVSRERPLQHYPPAHPRPGTPASLPVHACIDAQHGADTPRIGAGVDPANGAAPAVPEGEHGTWRPGPAHPVDVSLVWQYNRPNAFAWNCLLVDLSGAYPAYDGARDDNQRRQWMFAHIASDPEILGGKPCVKDTRISVELILELFASGATHQDVLDTYPHLTTEGITEALRYAARFLKNENILVAEVAA